MRVLEALCLQASTFGPVTALHAPTPDWPVTAPHKALAWRIVGQGASITRRAGGRPLTVVQIVVTVARKRTGERRLNAVSNSRPIRPWPGVSSGEMPNTFCAGAPGRWLRYTLMTAAVTYMNATPVRKPDRTGGDSQDCLCRPLPRRKKAVTSTITWRIAPAPTPRARADHWVP